MIGRNTEHDGFHSLVQAINDVLGPSNGIDSEDVDENELQELMKAYVSDESEWKKYFFPSETIPYTRNVVDKGNGKSNLVQPPTLRCDKDDANRTAHPGMGSWKEEPDS
jgi:cysteine dioxygenase